jgi:hypothetical protein
MAQLGRQCSKVGRNGNSEARSRGTTEAQREGNRNVNVGAGGVGGVKEEVAETVMKSLVTKPKVELESSGGSYCNA